MSEVLRAVRAHQASLEIFCQEVAADRGVPLEAVRATVFTDDYLAVHQAPAGPVS